MKPERGELGRAVLGERHDGGWIAYIFPTLIERLCEDRSNGLEAKLRFARLLGYTMAHELGHLLGIRHGDAGLMRPSWSPADLDAMRFASLQLSTDEAEQILAALSLRSAEAGD